ncbi:MAG: restriction endonuclease subunit S [Prolixibacteraceae bacterium]|nr:restriction endonuclease subunit S [Prolixibacteraceae bacterium]
MKTQLKNIATIQTGVFAKPTHNGDIVYLQVRHFDENGLLLSELDPDLMADDISEKHILKIGDVLFAAKGTKNFAAVFEDHYPPSVASTSFFVIRTLSEAVLPQYLAWYLNNHDTQQFLKNLARGTSIASISKAVLDDLEIFIPDLKAQKLVLKITQLRNKEKELKKEIEILREKYIHQLIINEIK